MKVLQLGPFPPPHGGVQTNLVAIRNHLRENGHSCAVINITRHRKAEADQVYYPESAAQTARLLWQLPADIVHLHLGGNLTPRLLALCLLCTCLPNRKTVITFHSGGYPSSPEGRATSQNSFAGYVFRRLNGLIAVNQEIALFFHKLGVEDRRIRVISPHSAASEIASELPEPLHTFWQTHHPVLLSVGLLEPEYELPLQIAALGRVRETHPRAGLIMIGSGSLEADLRARIAGQPWAEHLLLPGDVPHDATLLAIQECAMLLRTTRYDGDSLSVREALDIGTPVIATSTALRPPGCRLLPENSLEPLVGAIQQELAVGPREKAPVTNAHGHPGASANLSAVLDFYNRVLR